MPSRRDLLKNIGLGMTALTVSGATLAKGRSISAIAQGFSFGEPPWWLLAPLSVGASVGKGWRVHSLGVIEQGATILQIQNREGDFASVHICVHDGEPKGMAHTEFLDLILMDGGQGDKPTNEELGRVLMGIARKIKNNELDVQADFNQIDKFQTHSERVDRYGPENLV